jgi:hypothetical protein
VKIAKKWSKNRIIEPGDKSMSGSRVFTTIAHSPLKGLPACVKDMARFAVVVEKSPPKDFCGNLS